MAVYAAHLTRTLQGTPSIFQVSAQEALGSTVKPALKKLFEYLAAVHPKKCGWILQWFDELYVLFDYCLQYHYLKHYAASFSESFYGLLRAPISGSEEFNSGHQRLPRSLERGSLALLVLLPYVRDKWAARVHRWRDDLDDGRLRQSSTDRARHAAIKVFAIVTFVCEAAKLVQTARYLTGASRSPSLPLALLQLTLRDAPPPTHPENSWADLTKALFSGRIGAAAVSFPMVGGLVLRAVEYGAFAVQFLRWWEARGPPASGHGPPPPPPKKEERDERWRNKCPICLQMWKIPTVLPVSGYVFCYVCISRRLRATPRCPVSGLPADGSALVRLYVD